MLNSYTFNLSDDIANQSHFKSEKAQFLSILS